MPPAKPKPEPARQRKFRLTDRVSDKLEAIRAACGYSTWTEAVKVSIEEKHERLPKPKRKPKS